MKSAMEAKKRNSSKQGTASTTNAEIDVGKADDQDEPSESTPRPIRKRRVQVSANGGTSHRRQRHLRASDAVPVHVPLTGIEELVSKHGLDHHAATQVL